MSCLISVVVETRLTWVVGVWAEESAELVQVEHFVLEAVAVTVVLDSLVEWETLRKVRLQQEEAGTAVVDLEMVEAKV